MFSVNAVNWSEQRVKEVREKSTRTVLVLCKECSYTTREARRVLSGEDVHSNLTGDQVLRDRLVQ